MPKADTHVHLLILAAGASRRMGQIKQLLPWGKHTLLEQALTEAQKVSNQVSVVLGAHAEKIKTVLPPQVQTIFNPAWQQGMGTSIAVGVRYVLKQKSAVNAVLVLLGDQPLLGATHLNQLLVAHQQHPDRIIATAYPKNPGVPALFPANYFGRLQQLNGDQGARKLLQHAGQSVVQVAAVGDLKDLDTWEDYCSSRSVGGDFS
ncbi:MAG: nucleotidyltransferase family protein [Bacteroidota bacterium]